MTHEAHFRLADDFIAHVDAAIATIKDPLIVSRYVGFVAVLAVTVYELAIKTIFLEFAAAQNPILETFVTAYFDKINGRIRVGVVKADYLSKFGDPYLKKFGELLTKREEEVLKGHKKSVLSSYDNIITWRNEFAHQGQVPATPTYEEVKTSYQVGKNVIDCLAKSFH